MRCAVLGAPIGHSLSPALHRAAYGALGLDWTYDAIEVSSEGLAAFLDSRGAEWRGLSLTMPLKRTAVGLVDEADEWTRVSGAANTVLLGERRMGANTDIPGAVAALGSLPEAPRTAVVLGGGATAASVLLALGELGCHAARLLVRSSQRAAETLDVVRRHPGAPHVKVGLLGGEEPLDTDVVVSTVPAEAQRPALLRRLRAGAVFDVVYDPWPTPLGEWAHEHGLPALDGLDLLAHQAVGQVRLMTGAEVPAALLREAGLRELRRRAVEDHAGGR